VFDHLLPIEQLLRKGSTFEFSGIDSLEKCLNKDWFLSFKDSIDYKINSWGFRDYEQEQIKNNYVAIGDSYTMGLGQPFHCIWPKQLELILKENVINLSSDGASNQWILEILKFILPKNPKAVFVMLSFSHRELKFLEGTVEHLHFDPSINENILIKRLLEIHSSITMLKKEYNIPILISAIPDNTSYVVRDQLNLINYLRFSKQYLNSQLILKLFQMRNDLARDGYHFGEKTSLEIAQNFSKALIENKVDFIRC
jgi:hypothetical protein